MPSVQSQQCQAGRKLLPQCLDFVVSQATKLDKFSNVARRSAPWVLQETPTAERRATLIGGNAASLLDTLEHSTGLLSGALGTGAQNVLDRVGTIS